MKQPANLTWQYYQGQSSSLTKTNVIAVYEPIRGQTSLNLLLKINNRLREISELLSAPSSSTLTDELTEKHFLFILSVDVFFNLGRKHSRQRMKRLAFTLTPNCNLPSKQSSLEGDEMSGWMDLISMNNWELVTFRMVHSHTRRSQLPVKVKTNPAPGGAWRAQWVSVYIQYIELQCGLAQSALGKLKVHKWVSTNLHCDQARLIAFSNTATEKCKRTQTGETILHTFGVWMGVSASDRNGSQDIISRVND